MIVVKTVKLHRETEREETDEELIRSILMGDEPVSMREIDRVFYARRQRDATKTKNILKHHTEL
jgi:hypothetical protein